MKLETTLAFLDLSSVAQLNVVPAISDPYPVTPEAVTRTVVSADQRVKAVQESPELDRGNRRQTAVQINSQRQQQDQFDLFAAIATGGSQDHTNKPGLQTFAELNHPYIPLCRLKGQEMI
ncbi:MAG: hypothetical protein V7629_00730 [Motiliproteus sp.]